MTEKTEKLINELNKNGFLTIYSDNDDSPLTEFFEKYSIYIPIDRANELDKNEFLAIFLASKYINMFEALTANEIFSNAQWLINNLSIKNIIEHYEYGLRNYKLAYKDNLVLVAKEVITTDYDGEEEIYLKFKTYYMKLNLAFTAKYCFNVGYTVPNYCFKLKEDMKKEDYQNCTDISQDYALNRQIDRRYKVISNMPTITNELNKDTKIYTIMDKNIMRAFSDLSTRTSFYSKRCVILNPNLTYFVEEIRNQIPISHLLALFDYNEKEILRELKKVSYITDTFTFIGLGGLVSNFLFWCERLREHFDLEYVFKNMIITEPDNLEFSNLFRIPLNWKDTKVSVSTQDPILSDLTLYHRNDHIEYNNIHQEVPKMILTKSIKNLSPKIRTYERRFENINLKKCILIGGPDLDTRIKIYDKYYNNENIHFICTTHTNNTVSIDTYPYFDRELTVETYGNIDLNKFLLNMFKMSIELIIILANKIYVEKRKENLLEYSIDNENFIANSQKHKCLKNIAYAFN